LSAVLSSIFGSPYQAKIKPQTHFTWSGLGRETSMESTPRILLIGEVASLLRISIPTLRRWLHESRRGQRNFPIPISEIGGKCRWLASDIEAFIASQSVAPLTNPPTSKKIRQDKKAFLQRQALAEKTLERHRSKANERWKQ